MQSARACGLYTGRIKHDAKCDRPGITQTRRKRRSRPRLLITGWLPLDADAIGARESRSPDWLSKQCLRVGTVARIIRFQSAETDDLRLVTRRIRHTQTAESRGP